MPRRIMLIPVGTNVGLTSVSLGLVRVMQQQGLKVNFFKPVGQPRHGDSEAEKSTTIVTKVGLRNDQPRQNRYFVGGNHCPI